MAQVPSVWLSPPCMPSSPHPHPCTFLPVAKASRRSVPPSWHFCSHLSWKLLGCAVHWLSLCVAPTVSEVTDYNLFPARCRALNVFALSGFLEGSGKPFFLLCFWAASLTPHRWLRCHLPDRELSISYPSDSLLIHIYRSVVILREWVVSLLGHPCCSAFSVLYCS